MAKSGREKFACAMTKTDQINAEWYAFYAMNHFDL